MTRIRRYPLSPIVVVFAFAAAATLLACAQQAATPTQQPTAAAIPTAAPVPTALPTRTPEPIAAISGGLSHSIALTKSGIVLIWGGNTAGQLGDGTFNSRRTPVRAVGPGGDGTLTNATAISGAQNHSLAVRSDGTVWAWGNNSESRLGDGTITSRNVPGPVLAAKDGQPFSGAKTVSAALRHSLALKTDSTVWAWGGNAAGKIGDGTDKSATTPVQVVGPKGTGVLDKVVGIGAGEQYSAALRSDGTVWTWGSWAGEGTEAARGADASTYAPAQLPLLSGITAISAGSWQGLALKGDGTVWAWGRNDFGQIGDGSKVDPPSPVQVAGLTKAVAVSGGYSHSLALDSSGAVWAWGRNNYGQLGTESSEEVVSRPILVAGLEDVIAIAAGGNHSLALKRDGTLWAWGYNYYGQLGNGSTDNQPTPVRVAIP